MHGMPKFKMIVTNVHDKTYMKIKMWIHKRGFTFLFTNYSNSFKGLIWRYWVLVHVLVIQGSHHKGTLSLYYMKTFEMKLL